MTPTRSGRAKLIAICFALAVWIAFEIAREDPEIHSSFVPTEADDKSHRVSDWSLRGEVRADVDGDIPPPIETSVDAAVSGLPKNSSVGDAADHLTNDTWTSTKEPILQALPDTTAELHKKSNSYADDELSIDRRKSIAVSIPGKQSNGTARMIESTNNATRVNNILPMKRTQILDSTKKFSFVHISKAAGSTWIRTLLNLPLNTCPDVEAGKEYPVWYQDNKKCPGSDYHMLSLRSPRHHVWSLFTECKYDDWGLRVTKGLKFPRSGSNATSDEMDFDKWLDHFLPMDHEHQENYKCYHPANFQTRYLESKVSGAHGVLNRPNDTTRFEGNFTRASSTYWDQDFVAVVELHHESMCLLYHRLGPNAPEKARQYLNAQCVCPKPMTMDANLKEVHVVHHANGHRKELRSSPKQTLQKIEMLTVVDKKLYLLALRQILVEIAWLESEQGLDRRVLCTDVLEKLEPELLYLNVSVLHLYEEGKAVINQRLV